MRVREAELRDAPAMAHVIVDTFLASHRDQMPEVAWKKRQEEWTYDVSERAWARTLRGIADGTNPRECLYVAETESGDLIGLAMGQPFRADAECTDGEINVLYVLPERQRLGIGRHLVQAVASRLARYGMTTLRIAVLKANTSARCFYEALGGRIIGEQDFDEEGFALPEVVYGWPDIRTLFSNDY